VKNKAFLFCRRVHEDVNISEMFFNSSLVYFYFVGDSLSSLQRAIDMKESTKQQLREQLDAVEKETRSKLLEIDAFNTQLKVLKP